MPDATDALLDRLIGDAAVRAALDDVHVEARRVLDAIDPDLSALCSDRAALLIGLTDGRGTTPTTDLQRACVDLVEQIVLDVTGVTDAQVDRLAAHLGADGAASLVHAALVMEQRLRMQALWRRLGLDVAA